MVRVSFGLFCALLIAFVVGCTGDDVAQLLAPGAATIDRSGATVTVRGRLAFVDAAGNPVAAPADGGVVIIGLGSLAVRVNSRGEFLINRLPVGQALVIRALILGFLPFFGTIPADATSLPENTLRCQQDPDMGDNPTIIDVHTLVDDDGVTHLRGGLPPNAEVRVFLAPGATPTFPDTNNFPTTPVQVLQTQYQGPPAALAFDTPLNTRQAPTFQTGMLFACISDADGGWTVLKWGTCGLTFTPGIIGGTRVQGTITAPTGGAAAGAEVLVWDSAAPATNREDSGTNLSGVFDVNLPAPPAGVNPALYIHVQWQDPNGVWWICVFAR